MVVDVTGSHPEPAASRPFRVLMVCTANQVRSAMAERVLRRDLGPLAAPRRIEVRGAGTRTEDGRAMLPLAAAEMGRRGIDVSDFRSRALTDQLVSLSDLVLTATREHRSTVLERVPLALKRTFTLREFAALVAGVGTPGWGADPAARPWHLPRASESTAAAAGPAPGDAVGDDAAAGLRELVRAAAARRGAADLSPDEYDITDPAGRPGEFYAYAAQLIEQASVTIARALAFAAR